MNKTPGRNLPEYQTRPGVLEAVVNGHAKAIRQEEGWDPVREASAGLFFCDEVRGTARSVEDRSPTACRCTEHVKAQDECTKIKMERCALRGMKCAFPSDRKYFSEMGMAASSRREEEQTPDDALTDYVKEAWAHVGMKRSPAVPKRKKTLQFVHHRLLR